MCEDFVRERGIGAEAGRQGGREVGEIGEAGEAVRQGRQKEAGEAGRQGRLGRQGTEGGCGGRRRWGRLGRQGSLGAGSLVSRSGPAGWGPGGNTSPAPVFGEGLHRAEVSYHGDGFLRRGAVVLRSDLGGGHG